MNYSYEEILKRLRNGESADSIAEEMTKALNGAKAAKEKEEEAKRIAEENAKKEAAKKAELTDIANEIAELIMVYLETAMPEEEFPDDMITGEMLREGLDSILEAIPSMKELSKLIDLTYGEYEEKKPKKSWKEINFNNAETVLRKWIAEL